MNTALRGRIAIGDMLYSLNGILLAEHGVTSRKELPAVVGLIGRPLTLGFKKFDDRSAQAHPNHTKDEVDAARRRLQELGMDVTGSKGTAREKLMRKASLLSVQNASAVSTRARPAQPPQLPHTVMHLFDLSQPVGIRVAWNTAIEHVEPGGQAANLGVEVNSRVVQVAGVWVSNQEDVQRALSQGKQTSDTQCAITFCCQEHAETVLAELSTVAPVTSKSGILRKQGHVVKNWRYRYFVMMANPEPLLMYYVDVTKQDLKGTINLRHAMVIPEIPGANGGFLFSVKETYSNGSVKTFPLEAKTAQERTEWVGAINNVIRQCQSGIDM